MTAEKRLWALVMAWRSPVKCRLMASLGMTRELPPPTAPPLSPNNGPSEGSRSAPMALTPIFASPSVSPMVVTVLPSPAGVGVMAVTSTRRPRGLPGTRAGLILTTSLPRGSTASSGIPRSCAMRSTLVPGMVCCLLSAVHAPKRVTAKTKQRAGLITAPAARLQVCGCVCRRACKQSVSAACWRYGNTAE